MPSKMQFYAQMADQAAKQITGSYQSWISFLQTAGRLYKYPYNEQVMIHAQRPDATACAEYDFWNRQWGRYVRRGSKGIALIDTSGENPRLRYVFDVADTGTRENSRAVRLWELQEEHEPAIRDMLERSYGVPGENGLREQLETIAAQLADEYWNEHQRDILDNIADSYLEEYDNYNVGVQFRNAASVSIAYALMSRCDMEPDEWFQHEDFLSVFDFNTPATVAALGTAVSESNQQVLRQIEVAIRNYERENSAERTAQHGNDVHEERGLSDSRSEPDGSGAEAPGQVREAAEGLSEGASPDPVEQDDPVRDPVFTSEGDRRDSEPEVGTDDAQTDGVGGRDGEPESQRSDEVGANDEQPESPGRGSDPERADLQLNPEPIPGQQLSLFPSEEEQIAMIDEGMSAFEAPIPFSMSIPQDVLDQILRLAGNQDSGRMNIVNEFSKGKSAEEIANYLQSTFHGGNGIITDEGRYSAWYAEDGIHVANGSSARYLNSAHVMPWTEAAERIGELLNEGAFASNVELAEAAGHERQQIAQSLWYLSGDLSDEARNEGYLSILSTIRGGGFPDETERLANSFLDADFLAELRSQFAAFWTAREQDRSLLRFNYHKLDQIYNALNELSLERKEYRSNMAEIPEVPGFITEDEIAATLSGGSGIEGGKGRIYAFFTEEHTTKELADFLKNEYGIGGRSHAVSGASHSGEDYNSKGISLKKGNCTEIQLSWNDAAKRILELIRKDRFLTPAEREAFDAMRNADTREQEPVRSAEPVSEPVQTPRELTQADIDESLLTWNGDPDSRERMFAYMREHGRERGAAAWLSHEYGGNEAEPLHFSRADSNEVTMSWTQVQRRLLQLMNEGRFTEENRGIFLGERDDTLYFYAPVNFGIQTRFDDAPQPGEDQRIVIASPVCYHGEDFLAAHNITFLKIGRDIEAEQLQGKTDEEQISVMQEAAFGEYELSSEEIEKVIEAFNAAGLSYNELESYGGYLIFNGDNSIYTFDSWEEAGEWIDGVVFDEPERNEAAERVLHPERYEPEEPQTIEQASDFPYSVGDTVYLEDGKPFIIENIGMFDIQLRDPSLAYPILRAESKENFARLMERFPQPDEPRPEYTYETVAEYPAEENHLPYDVVIQTIKSAEPDPPAQNFRITDDHLGEGGPKAKFRANMDAINLLKELEFDSRQATPDEQEILSKYVGWGGLADAFDESKANWKDEFAELYATLTPEE